MKFTANFLNQAEDKVFNEMCSKYYQRDILSNETFVEDKPDLGAYSYHFYKIKDVSESEIREALEDSENGDSLFKKIIEKINSRLAVFSFFMLKTILEESKENRWYIPDDFNFGEHEESIVAKYDYIGNWVFPAEKEEGYLNQRLRDTEFITCNQYEYHGIKKDVYHIKGMGFNDMIFGKYLTADSLFKSTGEFGIKDGVLEQQILIKKGSTQLIKDNYFYMHISYD